MGVDSLTTAASNDLLDESTVVDYLIGRGLVDPCSTASVSRLAGGVSNIVLRVDTPSLGIVVKQALGKLDVADDWFADRGRAQHEAEALRVLATITPEAVPALLDNDPEAFALSISAAPSDWVTWKTRLMAGVADPLVAARLGGLLRTWHDNTADLCLDTTLDSLEAFRQLRIQPYFEVSARRSPDLSSGLLDVANQLCSRRECLVLGDFSPKNVLVGCGGPTDVWVIDHEVAHRGDPAFDVAFMSSHLLLKALHLTEFREQVSVCLNAFLDAYGDGLGQRDADHTARVLGALLVARVMGSSPVEYLTRDEKTAVMNAGALLLNRGASSADSTEPFAREISWLAY